LSSASRALLRDSKSPAAALLGGNALPGCYSYELQR
jgi:hypothetical protein